MAAKPARLRRAPVRRTSDRPSAFTPMTRNKSALKEVPKHRVRQLRQARDIAKAAEKHANTMTADLVFEYGANAVQFGLLDADESGHLEGAEMEACPPSADLNQDKRLDLGEHDQYCSGALSEGSGVASSFILSEAPVVKPSKKTFAGYGVQKGRVVVVWQLGDSTNPTYVHDPEKNEYKRYLGTDLFETEEEAKNFSLATRADASMGTPKAGQCCSLFSGWELPSFLRSS
ncbi:unnamed protein product [Amoebophrya sp. A120]|nr:unnamed protein product [Amoebophrya sp. A120]|eukprot:GSA120T00020016001.1